MKYGWKKLLAAFLKKWNPKKRITIRIPIAITEETSEITAEGIPKITKKSQK